MSYTDFFYLLSLIDAENLNYWNEIEFLFVYSSNYQYEIGRNVH